jgi:hypothetical protein
MANRFTATEKWSDPWFCELSEKDKLFWIYLVDNCDHAGIWQVNWPLVRFYIKDYVLNEKSFNGRIVKLREDKWFIPKFIEFQYKTGLNPENRAHQSVLNILEKEGASKGLVRGCQARTAARKDMVKEEYKYIVKDEDLKTVYKYISNKEFNNIFKDYLKMRERIKKPATEKAISLVLKELHKYDIATAIVMIEQSIINSWQGIFPLKTKSNLTPAQNYSAQSMQKLNERLKKEGYKDEEA